MFSAVLRDPTAKDGERSATVTRLGPPDSGRRVEINVTWMGLRRPPRVEEDSVIALSHRVLGNLREACAPHTPTPVECDRGDGHVWRCAPAA